MAADTGWIAGGSVATGFLALVTAGLAWKTKDLAKSAQDEAAASLELVQEARRDRELAHRPFLNISGLQEDAIMQGRSFTVRNIGTGPAIGCLAVVADTLGAWMASSGARDLASGESTGIVLQQARSSVPDYFDSPLGSRGAVFCRDVLDLRHAFLLRTNRENQVSVFAWQSYRVPSEDDAGRPVPRWVTEPQLWETSNP